MRLHKKIKILIIDDEELICWSLKHTFEKLGYLVNCVYTGNDALAALTRDHYDLVITDLNLPDLNSNDIIKKIRLLTAGTPVIVISAHLTDYMSDDLSLHGVYKCINKPFEMSEIIGDVREVVSLTIGGVSLKEWSTAK